jgi:hypothetical protein
VRGRWKLTFADAEPLEGLMTLVMERRPESGGDRGGWRIVHDCSIKTGNTIKLHPMKA